LNTQKKSDRRRNENKSWVKTQTLICRKFLIVGRKTLHGFMFPGKTRDILFKVLSNFDQQKRRFTNLFNEKYSTYSKINNAKVFCCYVFKKL